jgi:hypothetical protein
MFVTVGHDLPPPFGGKEGGVEFMSPHRIMNER